MEWNFKDQIATRVIEYYAATPPVEEQIMHTQAVANYTRMISVMAGMDSHTTDLMEIAAWLHDIGCPNARNHYGDSLPAHQQTEGEKLVREWLKDETQLTDDEKEWLALAVGHHHQHTSAVELHFEPLYDADLIVNLWEGYYDKEQAEEKFRKLVCTKSALRLFDLFFISNKK